MLEDFEYTFYDEQFEEKDLFLRFDFMFSDREQAQDALRPFGLQRSSLETVMDTRLMILANAMAYQDTDKHIAYSLNPNRYTGMQRYYGAAYGYRRMRSEVAKLASRGLLEHCLVPPGSHLRRQPRQSSFKATSRLISAMMHLELVPVPPETIRLRQLYDRKTGKVCLKKEFGGDYVSRLVKYDDDEQTNTYRQDVEAINRFLRDNVELHWPGMEARRTGLYSRFDADGRLITPLQIYRTFCRGSFELYGRYHGFWQNEKKESRSKIILNGEETCEPDFSQLHLNLAYLTKGLTPPKSGYDIEGFDREHVKRAVAISLNACSESTARGALKGKLGINDEHAKAVIQAAVKVHHPIADMFHTDKGVSLMYLDSCILAVAMRMLVEEKVPFLPIHDSFCVPVGSQQATVDIMQEAFTSKFPGFKAPVKTL